MKNEILSSEILDPDIEMKYRKKNYSLKAQRLNNPRCDVLNHYATVAVAAIGADDCGHD